MYKHPLGSRLVALGKLVENRIRQRPLSLSELIWQAETFPTVLSVVFAIGTAVFTFIYFRERWSLLR